MVEVTAGDDVVELPGIQVYVLVAGKNLLTPATLAAGP